MKHTLVTLIAVFICGLTPLASPEDSLVQFIMEDMGDSTWFGVKVRNLNAEELQAISTMDDLGVYVAEVVEHSPAENAGLSRGDILIRLAGIPILGAKHFTSLIRSSSPGRTFKLEYLRDNSSKTTKVTLRKSTKDNWPSRALPRVQIPEFSRSREFRFFPSAGRPRLGIYYEDLTEQLGDFLGVDDGKGVLITSVIEASPAEKAGLLAGDVVVSIDGISVEDSEDLLAALEEVESQESFKIRIIRRGASREIIIKTEQRPRPKGRGLSI